LLDSWPPASAGRAKVGSVLMLSLSKVATLVRGMGFSQAAFVCAICLLTAHVINFEQCAFLLLFSLVVDALQRISGPSAGVTTVPARAADPSTRARFGAGGPGQTSFITPTLEGAPPKPPLLGWGCCVSSFTINARAQSLRSLALAEILGSAYPGLPSWAKFGRAYGAGASVVPPRPRRLGGFKGEGARPKSCPFTCLG